MQHSIKQRIEDGKAKSYLEVVNNFGCLLNTTLAKDPRQSNCLHFLETYFKHNPLNRTVLVQLYEQMMSTAGATDLAREVARLYAELTSKIQKLGVNEYGLPPIYQPGNSLTRIDELVDQTAYLKIINKLTKKPLRPTLCLPPEGSIDNYGNPIFLRNRGFIPYLKDHFEIITDKSECNYFYDNTYLSPFDPRFFKYTNTQYGVNSNFFSNTYEDVIEKKIFSPTFTLKDETIEISKKFLKSYGVKAVDEFVLLYIREQSSSSLEQDEYKNSNPQKYINAIQWFLQNGLKVIRIGGAEMSKLPELSGFIDLTSVERPGEVDIYLSGAAKFYFGSAYGPYSIANQFGVLCAVPSLFPYGEQRSGNFNNYLKFEDVNTKRIINIQEISERGLDSVCSPILFQRAGALPKYPTNDEVLHFAKETLDYIQGGAIFKANKNKTDALHKMRNYSGLSYSSLEL